MNLGEAIISILAMPEDELACIFAKGPWVEKTEATIGHLTEDLKTPSEIKKTGFEYFLEKTTIDEITETTRIKDLQKDRLVEFVIFYAEHDAFPPWTDNRVEEDC